MSDDSCIQCQKVVRPRQEALQCDGCQKWQHRTCNSGVPRDQYRQAVKDHAQLEWKCVTCTELKLVSEGKLQRYQRKQSRQTQGRLFALWDEYCNNSISASRLLKECASVYGPPPK